MPSNKRTGNAEAMGERDLRPLLQNFLFRDQPRRWVMSDNGPMWRIMFFIACSALVALSGANTPIARQGKPLISIVTSVNATPSEVQAAHELRDSLSQITGANIPLFEKATGASPNSIIVGQGDLASKHLPEVAWNQLGEEQTLIRKKGAFLIVAGGRTRGTLYAVNHILYKLGVRWWAPWATDMPQITNLSLPNVDESESPAFESRDPYWFHSFDADWAVHNYDNGANTRVDEAHGGKIQYAGFVHTYYALVPPEKLFATHPEWFSLIDGKRTTENAQLCTTNQALRNYVVEQVKDILRKNPNVRIVSVSQNDCFHPCQCDNCRALVKREGSESALVLDLANFVAEKIGSEFPNVAIDTLAYQWSRHAPTTMRPRSNVIVRLCSIECNFAFPLDGKPNDAFAKDVSDWSKLTNRLYIWDYCNDFANYIEPQPDYFTFGRSMKFLSEHGAKGIFEEGAYQSTGADMAELKAWVLGQLLWNPKLNNETLVNEFVSGYYGKASGPILEYLKYMQTQAQSWKLGFASPVSATFLGYETMVKAEKLWEQAESLVSSDPSKLWRVKQGHLSVQYVYLCRWAEFQAEAKKRGDQWLVNPSRKTFAADWLQTATSKGPTGWTPMTAVSEGGSTPQQFVAQFEKD